MACADVATTKAKAATTINRIIGFLHVLVSRTNHALFRPANFNSDQPCSGSLLLQKIARAVVMRVVSTCLIYRNPACSEKMIWESDEALTEGESLVNFAVPPHQVSRAADSPPRVQSFPFCIERGANKLHVCRGETSYGLHPRGKETANQTDLASCWPRL